MRNVERRVQRWAVVPAAVLMLACMAVPLRAADLQVRVSSQETQVGVPIALQVVLQDVDDDATPVLLDIPDVRVRSSGAPARNSQTTIINGSMSSKTSLTYTYELTPQKEGRFVIPAVEVTSGGKTYKSQPITVVVTKSETGDLLFVGIKGDRKRLYVGESLGLTLQIWLKPYRDARFGKLDEQSMWSCIDRSTEWGRFAEPLQNSLAQGRAPRGREVLRKDTQGQERSYYLYEIERDVQVSRPGQLAAEEINIVVTYPTRLTRSNDIFSMGRLAIAAHVQVAAGATVEPIEVLSIPTQGRPDCYSGAVGQYSVMASAKPTEVSVGDPITLTLQVSGTGNLQELLAPPFDKLTELTGSFRVPSDPLAGEVSDDTKKFTVSIRATSDNVKEIPAIPFAFFDPRQEKFITVKTEPIPLKVKPADKLALSQIVDSTGGHAQVARGLTESAGGILANYTSMDEVLQQEALQPGLLLWTAMIVPPLAFIASWTLRRRSERLRTDVGFARKRRAHRQAVARLGQATGETAAQAAAVSAAIGQYVADRCNLPVGGMTRASVVEHLRTRGVSAELVANVDGLLAECESIHYAGAGTQAAAQLQQSATDCIERLERERF